MTKLNETRYTLLVYDIPARIRMRNPSYLLRRTGARINLSAWVVPSNMLVTLPIKDWIEKGARVELVEFDEHEWEKIVAVARRSIITDVESMREYVERSVAMVRKKFAAVRKLASNSVERHEAQKAAEHYAYIALHRAKETADSAEEAALHFDLTGDVKSIVDSLRRAIKSRSAVYFALAESTKGGRQLKLAEVAS